MSLARRGRAKCRPLGAVQTLAGSNDEGFYFDQSRTIHTGVQAMGQVRGVSNSELSWIDARFRSLDACAASPNLRGQLQQTVAEVTCIPRKKHFFIHYLVTMC
eukprot:scaffold1850_cov194-Pinguiococcus_pyrenoidosus.AAC.3